MQNLKQKIEAVLFFKSEPMSNAKLASLLKVTISEVDEALNELSLSYEGRGFFLIKNKNEYTLGTNPELSDLIETIQKEELNKSLSKASLETLAIVLYKNGVSRGEIDYIRGVNSGFTLRALSVRGLIEKVSDPLDARKFIYQPTLEILSFLGISSIEQLPEFNELKQKLNQIQDPETEKVDSN